MTEYKEIDMYDTNLKDFGGKNYADHEFSLQENSKKIHVVKCIFCHVARLFLVGHDIRHCEKRCNGKCKEIEK